MWEKLVSLCELLITGESEIILIMAEPTHAGTDAAILRLIVLERWKNLGTRQH